MAKVGGVAPGDARAVTNFDKASQDLILKGEALKGKAELALKKAGDHVQAAGERGSDAARSLVDAVANVGKATGYSLKGGAEVVSATGHGAAGIAVGGAGVVVAAGEKALSLTARFLNAAARGLTRIANCMAKVAGDGTTATVKEIEGRGRGRLSERLFAVAGQQFKLSADGYKVAFNSFEQAVAHAGQAGVNVVQVAGYSSMATIELIMAAGRAGQSAVLVYGDAGLAMAALSLQAAENGFQCARDLTLLGAKFTAALGRLSASPADADKVQIEVRQAKEVYDAKFRELIRDNPQLRELPAAKQYLALPAAH